MAKTPSTMLALNTPAPAFALPDTSGNVVRLDDFKGKPLLVMFICNHCPFVKHVAAELAAIGRDYLSKGVGIVAINSNDAISYPEDSLSKMREEVSLRGYVFPYLFDEAQTVAKAYQAACTPDFYVFDRRGLLSYRGQLDDSRPGNHIAVTGADIRNALDAILDGKNPDTNQKPSIGCNIKWRGGMQPF